MATPKEISALLEQYGKFDTMFVAAVKANNTAEAEDIQLQIGKIREKLNALGVITSPIQDEQPEE
jgi:hypothetical protein